MSYLNELRNEHGMLLAIADQLEALSDAGPPDDFTPLFLALSRFNQLLEIHLLREDAVLYPRLRDGLDRVLAETAERFENEVGDLHDLQQEFDRRWTGARISTEWDSFGFDLRTLLGALRTRIGREDKELYPLLAGKQLAA